MTQQRHTWEDMVAAIGEEIGGNEQIVADEVVEYTSIIRYCEPWEIGNLIYWEKDVAISAGYRDIAAPWGGSRQTWPCEGSWRPGELTRLANDLGKDASIRMAGFLPAGKLMPMPRIGGAVVTDAEIEFFEPA